MTSEPNAQAPPLDAGFTAWLRQQRRRRDPVGDLSRDQQHDRCWSHGRARLETLHAHLEGHGAIDLAHDALDRAWSEWQVRREQGDT